MLQLKQETESENNLVRFLLCLDFQHLRPLRHYTGQAQVLWDGDFSGQAQVLWDGDFSLKWEHATNTLNL